jgi:hypothetical protein
LQIELLLGTALDAQRYSSDTHRCKSYAPKRECVLRKASPSFNTVEAFV